MSAQSVSLLCLPAEAAPPLEQEMPAYFVDLNLDQWARALAGDEDEYGLLPLLYTPADDIETVAHRHAVFRDLERAPMQHTVDTFLQGLGRVQDQRQRMARAHHLHEKSRWLLEALKTFCDTVKAFVEALRAAQPAADGFHNLIDYLGAFVDSEAFQVLCDTTGKLLLELGAIRYNLLIDGLRVEVSRYQDEPDYGQEIAGTFARFQSGKVERPGQEKPALRRTLPNDVWLNSVEERILTQLVKLFPDLFTRIDAYVRRYANYADPVVTRVARELQFYLRYRHYIAPLQAAGQPFCYPSFALCGQRIAADEACDLVLAHQLATAARTAIRNDFRLDPPERLLLVSGPNQGGKTTFARLFGQLHHLARLGVPVPARAATLMWWQGLFTHFERAEDIHGLHGKLEDDLVRIHAIIEHTNAASVVILNEIFSSTTTDDARFLGECILRKLLALGAVGVCVTFIDDLARLDPAIVSMASTVDARDPAIRTFKVVRKPPDGKAYARALAAKHHLAREDLEARI